MRTPEQFVKELHNINPNIIVLGAYTRAIDRISVKCLVCGKEWNPQAYSLLQGKGCPSCSAHLAAKKNKGKTGLKDSNQFTQELKQIDPSIDVLGTYINGHTSISVYCNRCGHKWQAKPYSLLQGHGCPRCAKSGTSFMEQAIFLSLTSALGEQVLSRDRKTIGMELDIFIPSHKYAIEVGNWFLHQRSIKRDTEKRNRCHEKGIRLITIYDNFPKGKEPIFQDDCITFHDDLNKTDHRVIRELIEDLFARVHIKHSITDDEWSKIEQEAYKNAKAMAQEEFVRRIAEVHPAIEVLGRYENSNRRIRVKCTACGYTWDGIPASMLSGDGCRKCGAKKAHASMIKDQKAFENEVKEKNPDVEVVGAYTGRHYPVKVRCKKCGFEWTPIASSVLRGSSHKGAVSIHKKLRNDDM